MHGSKPASAGSVEAREALPNADANEPGLLARMEVLASIIDSRVGDETNPFTILIDRQTGPVQAVIGGRPTLLFGTNNYLGLNHDPRCIAAATKALASYGTGATASRVAGGNTSDHEMLEKEIAALYGREQAVLFSTGFQANLGTIATLARQGDAIFLDSHCHASIIDAATLSGARVRNFRHNDATHLERLFDTTPISPSRILVVVEGMYSVWGDRGDLPALLTLAKKRGAFTLVDEAHSLGICGARGRGVAEEIGAEHLADVITGTLSKSVGVIGGFCTTNDPAFRALRLMARAYLFTSSLPPAIVASAREALRIIGSEHGLRTQLQAKAEKFHRGLAAIGLELSAPPAPIGSIRMSDIPTGRAFWNGLLARGILVNLMIPPAAPDRQVLLRFSVSAAHTDAHIDQALDVFATCFREMKSTAA